MQLQRCTVFYAQFQGDIISSHYSFAEVVPVVFKSDALLRSVFFLPLTAKHAKEIPAKGAKNTSLLSRFLRAFVLRFLRLKAKRTHSLTATTLGFL